MENWALQTLEFDKIRERLSSLAHTEAAKARLLEITPSADVAVIARLTEETTKAKELLVLKGSPPFAGAKDLGDLLDRAVRGGTLSCAELLSVASVLRITSSLMKYAGAAAGCLSDYFGALQENSFLQRRISDAVIAEDMIADEASPALSKIRREQRKTESSIRDILSGYTTGGKSKFLQENIVTIRGGRYVVPVKAEYKNEVKGLLHDTSASGATYFIEPLAVLEANNRLRELKSAESDEIERILSELTAETARFASQLELNCKAITDLACIFARASYSCETDGCAVAVREKPRKIKLIKARHPLLDRETVVPISLEFGGDRRSLIITGPNTGGKTVTLKTIGLFAIMAQCGLHLPCSYGSELPVFSGVLADIGDEQSIEQSLSTFSSHMLNIASMLREIDENSLVLFDEIGAGTDPVEGAALAVAILEKVKASGALSAATTHYAELKLYALENDDVLNASCEFDVDTLKPTYRLITGLPGRSNAFAISARLGLDPAVIERAGRIMKEDNIKFEDMLSKLESAENALEKEKAALAAARAEAQAQLRAAQAKSKELEENGEKRLQSAKEQANAILASAKASSEFVFDELNRLQREKDRANARERLEKTRADIRNSLKAAETEICSEEEGSAEDENYVLPRPLQKGDTVLIADIKKTGVVLSTDGKTATVQAGIIRTRTPVKNLRLTADKVEVPPAYAAGISAAKGAPAYAKGAPAYAKGAPAPPLRDAVRNEIDVRGETGDDAWYIVDRYLDGAVFAGYETVTIIHGKGTGALRAALWRCLKGDKRVKSFRSGRYGEGDTGVTVLTLAGENK